MQSRDHNDCRHQQDSQCKCTDQILIICHLLCKYNRLFDLQLNPWNSLAEQSVANAIVLASSAFPSLYPIRNAVMVVAQTDTPSTAILSKKSFVRIDSFNGLGFSSITALELWLKSQCDRRKTVRQQIDKSKCTGANGTGSAKIDATSTARIAPKFPDNKTEWQI